MDQRHWLAIYSFDVNGVLVVLGMADKIQSIQERTPRYIGNSDDEMSPQAQCSLGLSC